MILLATNDGQISISISKKLACLKYYEIQPSSVDKFLFQHHTHLTIQYHSTILGINFNLALQNMSLSFTNLAFDTTR
ncbi:hypothetical protein C1H46_035374 [Malus baccata]|uniref:Uncharacterized protein n=1 Tax=Malus baccata TaxID=106549 RepID=A0A540KXX6_MALBA|nr:hypothetical protein C1H46_035374 [Malus baccata]